MVEWFLEWWSIQLEIMLGMVYNLETIKKKVVLALVIEILAKLRASIMGRWLRSKHGCCDKNVLSQNIMQLNV